MIILFKKDTGEIVGVQEGRVHTTEQINAKVSSSDAPEGLGKLVINWRQIWIPDVAGDDVEFYEALDKVPSSVYDYKIDLKEGKLVPKVENTSLPNPSPEKNNGNLP